MTEFVLFDKKGKIIDSVDPYVKHRIVGEKVYVANHLYEYELSLENGNNFVIREMENDKE